MSEFVALIQVTSSEFNTEIEHYRHEESNKDNLISACLY